MNQHLDVIETQNKAKTYLKRFKGLKTIPSVAARLVVMLDDETASLQDFEEVIKMDPTLVLRLLKLVNSAYFSLRTKINNISEAVAYIGVDNLRNLIIVDALKTLFRGGSDKDILSRNRLWLHCSVTSICCQMISERIFVQKGEDAFLCGILHDIGLIVADQVTPGKFREFCQQFNPEREEMTACERRVMGTDHPTIGFLLTSDWKLNLDLCEGIRSHHQLLEKVAPESQAGILQIADYLVARLGYDVLPEYSRGVSQPLLLHIKQNIMGYRAILDDLPQEIQRAKEIYTLEEE